MLKRATYLAIPERCGLLTGELVGFNPSEIPDLNIHYAPSSGAVSSTLRTHGAEVRGVAAVVHFQVVRRILDALPSL